jgi:hypothetical protein
MREILFRGKQEGKGGWVYGGIQHYRNITGEYSYIIVGQILSKFVYIIPKTMGQYTGFEAADSNRYITVDGKKEKDLRIFEGDIVHILSNMDEEGVFEVIFDHGGWYLDPNGSDDPIELYIQADHLKEYRIIKVIGNVHDTPELLSRE